MKSSFFKVILLISIILIFITISGLEGGIRESKSSLIRKFDETNIYSGTEEVLGEGIGNDKMRISWGVAENIFTLIEMFEVTTDTSYLDKAYEYILEMIAQRDDNRGVTTYLDTDSNSVTLPVWRTLRSSGYYIGPSPKDSHLWNNDYFISRYDIEDRIINPDYPDCSFAAPYVVLSGNITLCISRFAEAVEKADAWHRYEGLDKGYLLNTIQETVDAHNQEWIDYNGNEIYGWLDNDNIDEVWWQLQYHARGQKNEPIPNNHYSLMGSSLIKLANLSGDQDYLNKAYKLALSLDNILGIDENNAFYWKYKYNHPDSNIRPEDFSHGRVTWRFIFDYFHSDINTLNPVFTEEDMYRLSNTFMRNIFLGDTVHSEWVLLDTFIIDTTDTLYTPDEMIIVTDTTDTTLYCWTTIYKDSIYDVAPLITGESYSETASENAGYRYYINEGRSCAVYWIPLCKYAPRIYEAAYNICSDGNYKGLKNLLYYYDDYKPCIVTSNPDSITCNKTEDVEIVFNNIKILGDLAVKIIHDGEVLKEFTFTDPFSKDTVWTAGHILDDFRTDKTEPLIIEYYSDNDGIKGPLRSHEIPIKGKKLYVEHMDEIPVLKYTNIEFLVKGMNVNWNDTLKYPPVAVPGCTIDIEYADGNINRGITDENGEWVFWNEEIDNTKPLKIKAYKTGCLTYRDSIIPYVWTKTSNAFGKNNQINVVRKIGTDSTAMVYSLGDSVVFGTSDNFGKNWTLDYVTHDHDNDPTTEEIIARGTDPVITELDNGYMIVWKDGLYLKYATKTSPWIVDTLNTQPTLWHSEGVLSQNSDNTMKYGAYINHRTLDPDGELIFLLINPDGGGILSADTMIKKDGSDGAIPKNSPFVAGYMERTEESYLAGCIDMNDRVAFRRWDIDYGDWGPIGWTKPSFNNPCLNPSIDFNGNNTTFVWEEINDDNTKDIWDYKITPTGTRNARNLSHKITLGINRYAKNRDNILYNYINEANTLIDFREGFSSELRPSSYILYEGIDSIHSYDVNIKKSSKKTEALYAITEGSNGDYRIKFKKETYNNEIWPILTTEPTDTTIVNAKDSPISDYVRGNFKVERLSVNIPVIDNNMENMIRLTTDDKNPHIPQVVMIDSEVMGVIYGGNAVKETDIEIPSYMREDNVITVTVDRQKGNPNRTTEIALYEYETEGTQTAKNNRIAFNQPTVENKPSTFNLTIDHKLSTINLNYSIPKTGHINFRIFDAAGRVVETVRSGSINRGNYSYTPKATKSGVYFAVMEYEGKVYKEKFIILK